MKAKRYTEEQIIGPQREAETVAKTKELRDKYGISEPTFYNWKAKYAGTTVSDVRRLKELESENSKVKKLPAESELDNAALKDLSCQKMMNPQAVDLLRAERGLGVTRACGLIRISRSLYAYQSRWPDSAVLRQRISDLEGEKRRYSDRRIHRSR